jgi:hypothetical protein
MVKLEGTRSNRNAIGARVTVKTAQSTQIREVTAGSSYASTNDFRVHFGLGTEPTVKELVVHWPSGITAVRKNVAANQLIELTEVPD